MKTQNRPTEPGFYWARWQMPWGDQTDPGPAKPPERWEVVEVFVNSLEGEDADRLMVLVAGTEQAQPLSEFIWCEGRIPAPGCGATPTGPT